MVTVDYLKEMFGVKEDQELAAIFSRTPGAVGQWRSKGSVPASIQILASELLGGMKLETDAIVSESQQEYVSMPVKALAGAGNPCDLQTSEPIGFITVHKDLDGPNIQVVEVRGRSMEPTIVNGARVGVDIEDKNIVSGELYACYIPHEGIVVKRINMTPDLVIIKSDNQSFEDHPVMIDRINWDTFIQGRVKWVLQKYM